MDGVLPKVPKGGKSHTVRTSSQESGLERGEGTYESIKRTTRH